VKDDERKVTVNLTTRHAIWPGGQKLCVEVIAEKVGAGLFLVDIETGGQSPLKPYDYRTMRRLGL
jgi:hypothetical protein